MIVLIIEDDEGMARVFRQSILPVASEVRIAHNLVEALIEMRRKPAPDMVLLDLRLPGSRPENTLAHIAELKAVNPRVVVLVITGCVEDHLPALAAKLGADGFRAKMDVSSQERLLAAVKETLQTRRTSSEPVWEKSLQIIERLSEMTQQQNGATGL